MLGRVREDEYALADHVCRSTTAPLHRDYPFVRLSQESSAGDVQSLARTGACVERVP